jgi:hypothetical protein
MAARGEPSRTAPEVSAAPVSGSADSDPHPTVMTSRGPDAAAPSAPVPPVPESPLTAPDHFDADALGALAGTHGDPLRGLGLLPGVGHVVSGLPLAVVRGAQPSATTFSLDGVRLPWLAHLLVGPTVVHPGLIGGLTLHRSGAPARFGRGVGGAVELDLAPVAAGTSASASLDLLNVGALVRHVMPQSGTEVTLAGRWAWTPWLATTLLNGGRSAPRSTYAANFADYQVRLAQQVGPAELRLFALGASDVAGLRDANPGALASAAFHTMDLRGRLPVAGGVLEAAVFGGWEGAELAQVGGPNARFGTALSERRYGARAVLAIAHDAQLTWRLGAEVERRLGDLVQRHLLHPLQEGGTPATVVREESSPWGRATLAGLWVEAERHWDGWHLVPGLRLDAYALDGDRTQLVAEPRLSLRRRLSGSLQLRGAVGLHHQPPAFLVDVPAGELAWLRLGLQRVLQVGAGADWIPAQGWTLSADAYVHPLLRTVEPSLLDADFLSLDPAEVLAQRAGSGLAWGGELTVRKELAQGWSLLGGYALLQATRTQAIARHDDQGGSTGTEVATFAAPLAQAHQWKGSVRWELGAGWTLAGGLHVNTGAPEAGGLSTNTQRYGTDRRDGTARWIAEDRDRVAGLPPFWRVDLRVDKAWMTGPVRWLASLDVQNASLSREVFRYDYRELPDGTLERAPAGLPPVPVVLPNLRLTATY